MSQNERKHGRNASKKGTVTIYIMFILVAILLLFIVTFLAPLGANINTAFWSAGNTILATTNESISSINDANVKAAIQDSLDTAQESEAQNVIILANLFKYGWIIVLAGTLFVVFILTRRMVEYGGGFV